MKVGPKKLKVTFFALFRACVPIDEGKMESGGGDRECVEWGNGRAQENEISHTKGLIEALNAEMFESSQAICK